EHVDEEPQHKGKGHALGDDEIGQLIYTVDDEEEGQHAHGQGKRRTDLFDHGAVEHLEHAPPLYDSAMVIPALLAALLFVCLSAPAGAAPAADQLVRWREMTVSHLAVVENTGAALDPSVQGEIDAILDGEVLA